VSTLIFKKTVAASPKMFDDLTIGIHSTPELVGKAAGWTKDLNGDGIAFRLGLGNLRSEEIVAVTGIIEDQTLALAFGQTQAAPDYLLIEGDRLGGAHDDNQIHMGGIKAGSEHGHIDQIGEPSCLEGQQA